MAIVDVLVQVRLSSSRVPRKALLDLGGVPCLEHVVARCRQAGAVREVVLCTSDDPDDDELATWAADRDLTCYRGALRNVLERYHAAARRLGSEVVVRVTGDSPLIDPASIDDAVRTLLEQHLSYVKVTGLPVGCAPEAFTATQLERALVAAVDPTRSEDLTYYLGRDELGPVGAVAARAPVARDDLVLALNRPEDLDVLRAVFGQAADPLSLTLGDAIAWLDDHPDVAASNREYVPKPTECDARLDLTRLTP